MGSCNGFFLLQQLFLQAKHLTRMQSQITLIVIDKLLVLTLVMLYVHKLQHQICNVWFVGWYGQWMGRKWPNMHLCHLPPNQRWRRCNFQGTNQEDRRQVHECNIDDGIRWQEWRWDRKQCDIALGLTDFCKRTLRRIGMFFHQKNLEESRSRSKRIGREHHLNLKETASDLCCWNHLPHKHCACNAQFNEHRLWAKVFYLQLAVMDEWIWPMRVSYIIWVER